MTTRHSYVYSIYIYFTHSPCPGPRAPKTSYTIDLVVVVVVVVLSIGSIH
jgi:hypothetical protein